MGRNANFFFPYAKGLVILLENSHPQLSRFKVVILSQQFPAIFDGLFFKVVTKGKISQHFKKGMVKIRFSYFVEIIMFP